MLLLVLGLLIWCGVHLFSATFLTTRQKLIERLGKKIYLGMFALSVLVGLVLIVFGWRSTVPEPLYTLPSVLKHPAMLLVVIGVTLFATARFPASRIKRILRHQQLTGVLLWAIAHLFLNGDSRSLILFATLAVWSLVLMLALNRRDGVWVKPEAPQSWWRELSILVIGVLVSAVLAYLHPYLAGVRLVA